MTKARRTLSSSSFSLSFFEKLVLSVSAFLIWSWRSDTSESLSFLLGGLSVGRMMRLSIVPCGFRLSSIIWNKRKPHHHNNYYYNQSCTLLFADRRRMKRMLSVDGTIGWLTTEKKQAVEISYLRNELIRTRGEKCCFFFFVPSWRRNK